MKKNNPRNINNPHGSTKDTAVEATRTGPTLIPDRSKVLLRPFSAGGKTITRNIINRILSLSEKQVTEKLNEVLQEFKNRHLHIEKIFNNRYSQILEYLDSEFKISQNRQTLIGAYFCHEYSPESAALFNPSIVRHPDQTAQPPGSIRFILSLRAVGEGHISSITFREGVIDNQNAISLFPHDPYVCEPQLEPFYKYEKDLFTRKLEEAGLHNHFCRRVIGRLPQSFTMKELQDLLKEERKAMTKMDTIADRSIHGILLLAKSNYKVRFEVDSDISQRILFPTGPTQSNGIEDARFVRFKNDDGSFSYYATYTAYDGKITLPQLLETRDFIHFKFITLNGPAVQNKGMALFPRKINNKFAMLSRQDDENILLMYSDNIHFWQTPKILLKPEMDWEFVKIGTCGSPIETEAGWLVLSHGVGAMRKYCIGAFLLDLKDPSKVIGRMTTPLLSPNENEREGYVPNVVYTCGALIHNRELIIPYAMSDYSSSFARVNLDDCLNAMI
ncbi:MAG: glycoside hydrolase family 130 protein [Spirochaetaceae bacterium]|nr:glycoside hydrolase family 130 protein [Spirochaetaceae bacterium]